MNHRSAQGKPELAQSAAQREVYVRPLDSSARRDLAVVLLQRGSAKPAEEVLHGVVQAQKSQGDRSMLDQTLRVAAVAARGVGDVEEAKRAEGQMSGM